MSPRHTAHTPTRIFLLLLAANTDIINKYLSSAVIVKTKEILPPWDFFFSSDRFTRPGPGVRPDAPRKKGVARLAEIMGRDMWNFFRAGFLAFLGCLPFLLSVCFCR